MNKSIWIGRDRREDVAFEVTRRSLLRHLTESISVHALELVDLQLRGLYTRPTTLEGNRMIDVLSKRADYDGAISTDHAIGRFLVPHLAKTGWAAFADGDMLVRSDFARVFVDLDPAMAVYCVKHDHAPAGSVKMDGQAQTRYARKNWSSMMILNCDHEANRPLCPEMVNAMPGRDLHRLCWLDDSEIGELDQSWNFLVGHSNPEIVPDVVHFTEGTPDMPGYEDVAFADEWRAVARGIESPQLAAAE